MTSRKLLGRVLIESTGMGVLIHKVRVHMVFDHFGHQSSHSGPCARQQVHYPLAARLGLQRPFNGFYLSSNAPHSGEKLLLLPDRVCNGVAWRRW